VSQTKLLRFGGALTRIMSKEIVYPHAYIAFRTDGLAASAMGINSGMKQVCLFKILFECLSSKRRDLFWCTKATNRKPW